MPRGKRNKLDLLSFLSADRRQAIMEEALGSRIREIFQRNSRATLGKLISGLVDDEHWGQMQHVRVETILRPAGAGASGRSSSGRRGRPPGSRARYSEATLDQLVDFIKKKPGLRSEEIQRELDLAPGVVKAGLARLRQDRRVKTSGQRRSTTYAAG